AFQLDGGLQQLTLGPSTRTSWHEPDVHFISRAQYDPVADTVQILQFDAKGSAFQCNAQGALAQLSGSKYLALAGQLHYDLQKLEPLLHPHVGTSVKLAGQDARPFHLEGALAEQTPGKGPTVTLGPSAVTSPSLVSTGTGQAGMSWKSAELYGFQFGPAELQARLAKGWLQ